MKALAFFSLCISFSPLFVVAADAKTPQPNILWITSEDTGPELGCYGDPEAVTPNIDALAARSLRFERCWSNAPVCAAARTTLIAGMYATSLGAEHMRSAVMTPSDLQLYPQVLRNLGYYCTNNNKTDYNFVDDSAGWDESSRKAHWRNRGNQSQPFFAIFNFATSHESQINKRPHKLVHDPDRVRVRAYHPDTPEVRRDWAQYYDQVTEMDKEVGNVLSQLEADGLADSTIVFYYGDHGSGMPRSKRWPFNSGLHVPLILHVPAQFKHLAPTNYSSGGVSNQLVSFVDFAPTLVSLAGATPPKNMQGVAFAGKHPAPPREFLFGFRGRMDERYDMVRSCTDGRYVYVKHFFPDRPYGLHVNTMFKTPTTHVWKDLFDAGKLNDDQAWFWKVKPVEDLFDLQNDRDEVHNLAGDAEYREPLERLRNATRQWMIDVADVGVLPEAEMHRLCGQSAPRTFVTSGSFPIEQVIDSAWKATSSRNPAECDEMVTYANDPSSAIRYWGVRGLTIRLSGISQPPADVIDALESRLMDPSPSVAIAAADGLLSMDAKWHRDAAIKTLLNYADGRNAGHYAAIEALNVLDTLKSKLTREEIASTKSIPRKLDNQVRRMGDYLTRLLDHIGQ